MCNTSASARSLPTCSASARAWSNVAVAAGQVAADAERPSERGQQARLVRAHGVAECRQRPLADLYPFDQPSTPHQLVHHRPAQPTDGLDLSERLVPVQSPVHRAQGIVPAADAPQRHRQSFEQLGTAELIGGRDERQCMLEVRDGVVKCGCVGAFDRRRSSG